jgi:FlgD Ig-like domain
VRTTVAAIAVTGVVIALSGGPARADSSTVVVPEHPAAVGVTLLGASPRGVVVRQDAIPGSGWIGSTGSIGSIGRAVPHWFTGAEGTQLARRPVMEQSPYDIDDVARVVDVDADTVAWARNGRRGGCNCAWQTVHRLDVRTGADQLDGLMPAPLAHAGGAWFSDAIGSYSTYPFPPPVLKRYVPASGAGLLTATEITPTTGNSVAMAVDGGSAVLASWGYSDPDDVESARLYRLDLVDLTTGVTTAVVAPGPAVITRVALDADRVVWDSAVPGQPPRIDQRARTGGAVTTYAEPAGIVEGTELALVPGKIGYLAPAPGGSVLRIVTGTSARTVTLPPGSAGLGSAGDHFVTATGGDRTVAGVYAVSAAGVAARVATLPPAGFGLSDVGLSGSVLHYADASRTEQPGRPLWMRTVTGDNHPALSAETLMRLPDETGAASYAGDETAFSAGRGAVRAPEGGMLRLYDRGAYTGTAAAYPGRLDVSGPYTLAGLGVFRPDGERIATLTATEPESTTASSDIYGSTVVFTTYDSETGRTRIWVDDVGTPHRTLLATIPARDGDTDCGSVAVSIWAGLVSWPNCDGRSQTVRDLTTGAVRTVPPAAPGDAGYVGAAVLGEGVLAWTANHAVNVLDLTSPTSTPVRIPGDVRSFALDDHRIVRATTTGSAPDGPVLVSRLPLGNRTYPPRLIGSYALAAFTPDGDGHADTWTPQFDVTKPVRNVGLSIVDAAGHRVRDLDAPDSPDGSIRGLSWDGRDRKGAAVPVGVYRWTLGARAGDGDGRLVGPRGEATVTGTIEIDAAAPGGARR